MRILTRAATEAIYEIINDLKTECDSLKKENAELREKITKKDEIIDYLNDKIFAANDRYATVLRNMSTTQVNVDFPATKPENKII